MILFRHLFSAFTRRVALSLLATVALLALGDFAELASSILGRADAATLTAILYQHKLPQLVLEALPLATLLGLLLTLANLESSRELLALESAGATPTRIAAPALVLALLLSTGGLYLARDLVPRGVREVVKIETRTLRRWTWTWTLFHKPRAFFLGPEGEVYEVDAVKDQGRRLEGVARYDARDGRLVRLSEAESIVHDGTRWHPSNARTWILAPDRPDRIEVQEGAFPIVPDPAHFLGVPGQPSELTRRDLERAIETRREQGRPVLPLLLERYDRAARPLLTLGLALLALGMGLGQRAPKSGVEAAAHCVAIAALGWTLLATCRAMGLAGMISPIAAAWLPVLLPGLLGVTLFRYRSR